MMSSMGVETVAEGRRPEGVDDVFYAYLQAKLAAEEGARQRPAVDLTILRPGLLTEEPGTGLVTLGRHVDEGEVPRDDVAAVMLALLDSPRPGTVLELVSGATPVGRRRRRPAVISAAPGAGDLGPGRQLVVRRVVHPHQGEPTGGRHRHLAGALRAGEQSRRPLDGRRPSPTAESAPTRLRTIEWQKASAEALIVTRSPLRSTSSASSVRMVVAPSRRRQKAAKSCSPSSSAAACAIAPASRVRGHPTVSARRSGGGPHSVSVSR